MAVINDLKVFKDSAWLGWQMEANWTDPFLFMTYSMVKPIAGTLILVLMYIVVTGGETANAYFSYMYVGNAMYMFVAEVLFGVTWVIHDDREHYMTLKQVYIAPMNFYVYILGRSAIKIAITSFGVFITLVFGVMALGVGINLAEVDWLLFSASLIVGLISICILGLALGGISFLTAKHSIGINEGLAGVFYVLSGVVFPITILPTWAQSISRVLPVTYWMEAMRRGLEPAAMRELTSTAGFDVTGMSGVSDMTMMVYLLASVLVFFILSIGVFRFTDYIARKKGKVDWTTAY
ncbi:MAG: ABC transporter permease [Methanobacteriota archaeon]|nr:MAG: ABC transporter permease [Euryarchaeota archaeon]